ncbi:MAG: TIGR01458 family HAD-type hydrolase [Methylomarinum sp.]|nr:TIGR01458 family HAD-type hydrolase [Methylomarinum sp.]
MNNLSHIKGILFDLDGVLYVGSKRIDGALEAINIVRNSAIKCRFITNTSTLSRESLKQKLEKLGFNIKLEEIISAPQAAKIYLQKVANPVCYLLLADDVKQDFSTFKQSVKHADFVIIGDIGDAWSYEMLNDVFNLLVNGAELIAIHKNRFWQTEHGLQMDIGAFIAALEYASGKSAVIIGKPSIDFFQMALNDMALSANEVAIIGDDIDSDIGGGQLAGLNGILVKTGKYRKEYADNSEVVPDLVLDSIADLVNLAPFVITGCDRDI